MHTQDEQELRLRARDAINRQLLPSRRPARTFGGPGIGETCRVCGSKLAADDMVFDLEFASDDRGDSLNLQLHVRCFAAWEIERATSENNSTLQSRATRATLAASEREPQTSGRRA